jgi:hypothetical protein
MFSLDKDSKRDNGLDALAYIAFLQSKYGVGNYYIQENEMEKYEMSKEDLENCNPYAF